MELQQKFLHAVIVRGEIMINGRNCKVGTTLILNRIEGNKKPSPVLGKVPLVLQNSL